MCPVRRGSGPECGRSVCAHAHARVAGVWPECVRTRARTGGRSVAGVCVRARVAGVWPECVCART
jgi:hypothetical protein